LPTIVKSWPIFSERCTLAFHTSLPGASVPEKTRIIERSPAWLSLLVLKTIAESGAVDSGWNSTFSSLPGFDPTTGPQSEGEGIRSTMVSSAKSIPCIA
jgi:hypothetical protein